MCTKRNLDLYTSKETFIKRCGKSFGLSTRVQVQISKVSFHTKVFLLVYTLYQKVRNETFEPRECTSACDSAGYMWTERVLLDGYMERDVCM